MKLHEISSTKPDGYGAHPIKPTIEKFLTDADLVKRIKVIQPKIGAGAPGEGFTVPEYGPALIYFKEDTMHQVHKLMVVVVRPGAKNGQKQIVLWVRRYDKPDTTFLVKPMEFPDTEDGYEDALKHFKLFQHYVDN